MKVNIEKLDYEGRGIAYLNGKIVFIPRTLPKEEAEIEIVKNNKTFSQGKVTKILKKSEERIPSFCPYAHQCGGCTFDIVRYETSLKYKKEIVEELFKRNVKEFPSFFVVPSRPVLGYRNKVSLHVQDFKIGYYEEESHRFVEIKECLLLHPKINELLKSFSYFAFQNGELIIRMNSKNEFMLFINTKEEVKINEKLIQKFPIVGIFMNQKCVYGKPFFIEERNDRSYFVHGNSFFQVNPYISECILEEVMKEIKKEDVVFDLYCGCGFFTFPIAKKVKEVIGIELNKDSLFLAEKKRKEESIENISFHLGKVENLVSKIKMNPTLVLVDPPRSGLEKKVLEYLYHSDVSTIIYISCNPKTLVRDLKELEDKYSIVKLKGFDMFSYTKHIEILSILKLKEKKSL